MIVKETLSFQSANAKNQIYAKIWRPEGQAVKGILQISHGMIEHIERYNEFAIFLAEKGFVVVGNDHMGHGKSIAHQGEWGYFCEEEGSRKIVQDLYTLTLKMKERYPGVPYFVLGHSMGSFMIRRYLMTYPEEVQGAIIMGTGYQSPIKLSIARWFLKRYRYFFGAKCRSAFLEKMMFGSYNKHFSKNKKGKEWLSRDEEMVQRYRNDPACSFLFTVNGIETLLETLCYIQAQENIEHFPVDMPVLIVSGSEDPVGDYSKGVKKVFKTYLKHGVKEIDLKFYEGARHEPLNETNRGEVYEMICKQLCCWVRKS